MMNRKAIDGFWHTVSGVVVHPWRTFEELNSDPKSLRKGLGAFLLAAIGYTAVLGTFIAADYPAAAPSALALPLAVQYKVQIWYQVPLFLLATLSSAGILVLLLRTTNVRVHYSLAMAHLLFASTVPFLFTTLPVELAIAALVSTGITEPTSVLAWLTGPGTWFASTYQTASVTWIVALFRVATKRLSNHRWPMTITHALITLVVYALPLAFLIR